MARTTADKIDFLMKLTNTSNAVLARALNFDASYISRLRNGKRGLPLSEPFIEPAAAFFAANIREDYGKAAAANMLQLRGAWPSDENEAAALLAEWLQPEPPVDPVERVIAAMRAPTPQTDASNMPYPAPGGVRALTSLYYGITGRRDGVIAFLSALCESGKPHTLLLTSDEDMAWLFEDETFARSWAALMGRLIRSGSRIIIIHSIGRDANDMWEAVRNWLPLYMTGAIQPYYYPRLRDGLLHRSLFVAAGHSALCSVSVQGQAGESMIQLLREKKAVQTLEQEFGAYLKQCRPLMGIALPTDQAELARMLRAFADAPGEPMVAFLDQAIVGVKKNAVVVKAEPPRMAFAIEEPRMVAAVEEYLQNLPHGVTLTGGQASNALERYIKGLR